MRAMVWFRADLRVADNTALHEACEASHDGVVAVFTICPEQWLKHDWSSVRVDFLLRNLADLSRSLALRNIPLLLVEESMFAGVPGRLLELAERYDCQGIWFNREYEVNEARRDQMVTDAFRGAGKTANSFTDQVVLPPDSIRTTQGGFYTVFTPYKKRWLATVLERGGAGLLPVPAKQKRIPVQPDSVPVELDAFKGLRRPDLWTSGEDEAQSRLQSFSDLAIQSYQQARDVPGCDGTSRISHYLAIGVLSPRQCLQAALEVNRHRLDGGSEGVVTWISELVWREFYRHVLVGYPWVCMDQPFDSRTKTIPWREQEGEFESWCQGRTGIPIVDAGMRQLARTGWMHNRVRMITAMFLTKNLFMDWRRGETHFMRHLVDGDFASNNGGWQWSASVGTDAVPYFRVFNPLRQSERFDPNGSYIRKFVPELADLSDKAIHLPHERAPEQAAQAGYPQALVDLKTSRQRAIAMFKEHRAGSVT